MSHPRAARYVELANKYRELAAGANNPEEREHWLMLAARCDKLALDAIPGTITPKLRSGTDNDEVDR